MGHPTEELVDSWSLLPVSILSVFWGAVFLKSSSFSSTCHRSGPLDCIRACQVGQVVKGGRRTHFVFLTTNSSSWKWSWKSKRVKEFANQVAQNSPFPQVMSWAGADSPNSSTRLYFFKWDKVGFFCKGAASDYKDLYESVLLHKIKMKSSVTNMNLNKIQRT